MVSDIVMEAMYFDGVVIINALPYRRVCTQGTGSVQSRNTVFGTSPCKEQEQEIIMLQNVMREQIERSKAMDAQEQTAFHKLNALEREAHIHCLELSS